MLDLARLAGDRELHAQAQLLKATALLELGDPAAPAELERYCRAAEDLGHARGRWGALSRRAVLASWPASSTRPHTSERRRQARRGDRRTRHPGRATPSCGSCPLRRLVGLRHRRTLGPARHLAPIRAVLLTARGDRPAAQSALAGYSLEQDRRHGVRRHDGWMPVIITEAVVSVGSEAQQERCTTGPPAGRPPPRLRRLHGLRRRRRPPPRHARRRARAPRRRRDPPASRAGHARDARGRRLGRPRPNAARRRRNGTRRTNRARQQPSARGRRLAGHVPRAVVDGPPRQGMLDLAVLLDRPGREVPASS